MNFQSFYCEVLHLRCSKMACKHVTHMRLSGKSNRFATITPVASRKVVGEVIIYRNNWHNKLIYINRLLKLHFELLNSGLQLLQGVSLSKIHLLGHAFSCMSDQALDDWFCDTRLSKSSDHLCAAGCGTQVSGFSVQV